MASDIGKITENPAISGSDGGRSIANIIYILYIVGFFTGITALVGVILAYVNRNDSRAPYRAHLNWQIKVFWRGIWFGVAEVILSIVVSIIAFATAGLGAPLYLLQIAIGLWWFVWTILAIIRGMKALGRGQEI
jgi:uncharacterized membrane protein